MWTFTWIETLWQDICFAARLLRKSKGFTIVAVLTLTVGIGANTAIFSLVDALLLRPFPVRDPQQLTFLAVPRNDANFDSEFSYAEYKEIGNEAQSVFAGQAAFSVGGVASPDGLTVDSSTASVQPAFVSGNFFGLLGIAPYLGRFIQPSDLSGDQAEPVVVLSFHYWQSRFHRDPHVIGKRAAINGHPAMIVGVAPEKFLGVTPIIEMQAYLPLNMAVVESSQAAGFMSNPNIRMLTILGRLTPGTRIESAQAALSVVGKRIAQEYPRPGEGNSLLVKPLRAPGIMSGDNPFPRVAALFMTLAALVLVLACGNLGNLLLVRTSGRQREIAVRAALGGSRLRLIRQLLTESLLLAALGCAGGILAGLAATRMLARLPDLQSGQTLTLDVHFDWRLFVFALAAALLTGIFVGAIPALRVSRGNLREILHQNDRTPALHRQRFRRTLVALQVAGSLTLLVVAGLFVRSLASARTMDLGFDPRQVLNATISPGEIGYTPQQGAAFYNRLLERAKAIPDVTSASITSILPLGEVVLSEGLVVSGYQVAPGQEPPSALYAGVSGGYFKTMGISLLSGRVFTDTDSDSHVVIVNQAMADRFWPGQNPIGKQFTRASDPQHPVQIIGVVRNTRQTQISGRFEECLYVPLAQAYAPMVTLQIRTVGNPEWKSRDLAEVVQSLAPQMPVSGVRTMERALDGVNGLFVYNVGAGSAAALGCLGLALAIIGVYGVMSYSASQRRHEIGIRMALGAQPQKVLSQINRQGLVVIAGGLLVGLLASVAVGKLMTGFLIGITSTDPATYIGVSFLLATAAFFASYIPARRATRIDPLVALRYE